MRALCDLSPPPSEGKKVHSVMVVHNMDMQPSSSYLLPMWETSLDLLKEVDEEISAPQSCKKI